MPRYVITRVDANAAPIRAGLLAAGRTVEPLPGGNGRPDFLVGYQGKNFLLEIKRPGAYKQKHEERQKLWHAAWRGQVAIVKTLEEALQITSGI